MMYCEFAEATGCRDNAHNREVFRNLEIMYMNSDLTKQQIYDYGMKLVDNSKSKEQIEFEEKILAEIEENKQAIKDLRAQMDAVKADVEYWKSADPGDNKLMLDLCKADLRYYRDQIKSCRNRINALKWVLE